MYEIEVCSANVAKHFLTRKQFKGESKFGSSCGNTLIPAPETKMILVKKQNGGWDNNT